MQHTQPIQLNAVAEAAAEQAKAILALTQEKQEMKSEIAALTEQLTDAAKVQEALEQENAELKQALADAQSKTSGENEEVVNLTEQLDLLSTAHNDLKARFDARGEELHALNEQIDVLRNQVDEFEALKLEAEKTAEAVRDQFENIAEHLDVKPVQPELIEAGGEPAVPTLSPAVARYFEIKDSRDPNDRVERARLLNTHGSAIEAEKARRRGEGAVAPDASASATSLTEDEKRVYAVYKEMHNRLAALEADRTLPSAQRRSERNKLKLTKSKFYSEGNNAAIIEKCKTAYLTGQPA